MSKLNSYVNYEQIIGHSIKIGKKIRLEPRLENQFNRITMVAKKGIERLTLDFNLGFTYNLEKNISLGTSV